MIRQCRKKDLDKKRPAHRWCLYSKKRPGRVIGRHRSKQSALRQERAIQINQHRG